MIYSLCKTLQVQKCFDFVILHVLGAPQVGLFSDGLALVLSLKQSFLKTVGPVNSIPPIPGPNSEPIWRRLGSFVNRVF